MKDRDWVSLILVVFLVGIMYLASTYKKYDEVLIDNGICKLIIENGTGKKYKMCINGVIEEVK